MIGLPFFTRITSSTTCWLDLTPFVLHFLLTPS
ncbi:hypothetical protein FOPG_17528 [Fusarium oxysporum f. sp. conglutinans race 2 54008]|uniref:Uncharacterized protein n=1 Tax=Fusarium oxysporum f. sp. conglutinans race 2 54008 TaxID=1089457 RepID=X0GRS6_FUSOX|nr:hypothetical protein FOPG_17528 [Fusarium oxysporum f. sp. conglutinans race 2 54008]